MASWRCGLGWCLADIEHVSAVKTDELRDMAAMVCMAAEVDSAFDHLDIHDSEFDA